MKKYSFYLSVLSGFILLFSGCTKETTIREEYNPNISVFGVWKVSNISETDLEFLKYLQFSTSRVLNVYNESNGFKSEIRNSFFANENQLVADFYGWGSSAIYSYSMKQDTLIISSGGFEVLKAVKANAAEVNGWVTYVSPEERYEDVFISNWAGMGYNGTHLLFASYNNGKVYYMKPSEGTISDSSAGQSSMNTVEFDAANNQYWISRNGWDELHTMNIATGVITSTSVALGPWIYGIGLISSTQIAAYSGNEQTFYIYNPNTNAIAYSKKVEGLYFRDMAVQGGKIFVVAGGMIYKMDPAGFVVEKAYYINGITDIYGIASWGGGVFWITGDYGRIITKVTLN